MFDSVSTSPGPLDPGQGDPVALPDTLSAMIDDPVEQAAWQAELAILTALAEHDGPPDDLNDENWISVEWSLVPAPSGPVVLTPGHPVTDMVALSGRLAGDRLPDHQVVDLAVAARRAESWGVWCQVTAAAELLSRWTQESPLRSGGSVHASSGADASGGAHADLARVARREAREASKAGLTLDDAELAPAFVVAELAAACAISEYQAGQFVDAAWELIHTSRLPRTAELLRTGVLDWGKVKVILAGTRDLTPEVIAEVEDRVVGRAPRLSQPALREALAAAVLAIDPAAAAERARRAQRDRRFWVEPLPDEMAKVCGLVTALDAALIKARLDAAASEARRAHDARTADQIRSDAFVHALTGRVPRLTPTPGSAQGERASRDRTANDAGIGERLPSPTETDSGACDVDDAAHRSRRQGSPDEQVRDPQARDPQARDPQVRDPQARDPQARDPQARDPQAPELELSDEAPEVTSSALPRVVPQVIVVVSLETLLGLRDDPAHLRGYGPVSASLAREVAAEGAWRCAVVDNHHGTLLGLGRSTYTPAYHPGGALTDLVRVGRPRCGWLGCNADARRCDLDHRVPHPDGPTCSCNLHPLCRRHHRLKTTGKLRVVASSDPAHPPGTQVWTTRAGHTYPDPPEPLLPPRANHSPGASGPDDIPGADDIAGPDDPSGPRVAGLSGAPGGATVQPDHHRPPPF